MNYHVKFWLTNSQTVSAVIKEYSFRTGFAPHFFPRFSIGDMKGMDLTRWRSWVQSRFDGGAGQLYFSSTKPTNRYAEGHLIDVGRYAAKSGEQIGLAGSLPVNIAVSEDLDESVIGDASIAILPTPTTLNEIMATKFTSAAKAFVVETSQRPVVWHLGSGWMYTSVAEPVAWSSGAFVPSINKLTGKWAKVYEHTQAGVIITSAVRYSQATFLAMPKASELWAYASVHTAGATPCTIYKPEYSTYVDRLAVYDDKLWMSVKGNIHYLEPASGTVPARWSDPITPGDVCENVLQMREFNGRLYFGKADGLYAYEAGRVYRVEDFSAAYDNMNFSMMAVHRGYLYFNIKHMLYRLSTVGTLELVQSVPTTGIIIAGASIGNRLVYSAAVAGEDPITDVWFFDPETGGTHKWFSSVKITSPLNQWKTVSSIATSHGLLFMMPIIVSQVYNSLASFWSGGWPLVSPIVAADVLTPPENLSIPGYAPSGSYLITSMLDFGVPNIPKTYHNVTIDYALMDPNFDRIDVSYITELKGRTPVKECFELALWGAKPMVNTISDDSTLFDGGWSTGRSVRWGQYPTISSAAQDMVVFAVDPDYPDVTRFKLFYTRMQELAVMGDEKQFWYYADVTSGLCGNWKQVLGANISITEFAPPGYPMMTLIDVNFVPAVLADKKLATTAAVTASGYLGASLYYWYGIRFANHTASQAFAFKESSVSGATKSDLATQKWASLGSISGASDYLKSRKSLTMPAGTVSPQLALRFDMYGSLTTRPEVRRVEVEFMPVPSSLRMYDFILPISNQMQMPDMVVTPNYATVATSVFSMIGAGKPYVMEMPWPTRHTINAVISLAPPGSTVPQLRTDQEHLSYAEIAVHVDEV